MVARFGVEKFDHTDEAEFVAALHAVKNNHPGALESMWLRSIEKRKTLRDLDMKLPTGMALHELDLPIVKFPEGAVRAIHRLGYKLGCALHYMYLKKLLPREGGLQVTYKSNFDLATSPPIAEEILKAMPYRASLKRCTTNLGDQFLYRFGVNEDLGAGMFLCALRRTLQIHVITIADRQTFPSIADQFIRVGDYLTVE